MRKALYTVAIGLLGGALAFGSPAAATDPKLEQSAEATGDCGELTLTLVNNHVGTYAWNIQTSDGQNYNVPVPYDESPVTHVVTLDSGDGNGWVSYGTVSGPESDYYIANQTKVVELCEPDPEPTPTETTSPEPTQKPTEKPTTEPTQGTDYRSDQRADQRAKRDAVRDAV